MFTMDINPYGDFLVEVLKTQKVNIQRLKKFALDELSDCPLREILLAESSDDVDIPTFLARLPIWLRLAKFHRRHVE